MRYRSSDETSATSPAYYVDYNKYGVKVGDSGFNHYGLIGREGVSRYITDEPHPGYAQRRKHGEIILGALTLDRTTREVVEGAYSLRYTDGSWCDITGDIGIFMESLVPNTLTSGVEADIGRAVQIVLAQALAKIASSPICSGEIIHDFDQTVGMLKRPFGASRDLLMQMHKYRRKRIGKTVASAVRAASNAWLEYRYGWKPLILDIGTISEEIRMKHQSSFSRRNLVARSKTSLDRSSSWSSSIVGGIPRCSEFVATAQASHAATVSAGVIYDVASQDELQNLNRVMGFRPHDVASTFWECIPYSFVVDWFANVGPWLQAIVPVPGVTCKGNWVTFTQDKSFIIEGCPKSSASYVASGTLGSLTIKQNHVNRLINQSLDLTPSLTINTLSTTHVVDSLALMVKPIRSLLGTFDPRNLRVHGKLNYTD